jgi:heme exporter protein C
LFAAAIALVFFYAPIDGDQGLSQKIFYFHVPIALTAYACFGWGAWKALLQLWKRQPGADLESYVAIHQGVIFGTLTLLTGSIWARISWGVWWVWSDDELVLFLVLFLFYSAYFMLRYSVEPGLARENMCAVYALFGVVLIPISVLAIRISRSIIHPEVFTSHGPQMTNSQFLTFCVCLLAMLSLFATLYQTELAGKRLDMQLRELRELLA